jgi:hypothetical protein
VAGGDRREGGAIPSLEEADRAGVKRGHDRFIAIRIPEKGFAVTVEAFEKMFRRHDRFK